MPATRYGGTHGCLVIDFTHEMALNAPDLPKYVGQTRVLSGPMLALARWARVGHQGVSVAVAALPAGDSSKETQGPVEGLPVDARGLDGTSDTPPERQQALTSQAAVAEGGHLLIETGRRVEQGQHRRIGVRSQGPDGRSQASGRHTSTG